METRHPRPGGRQGALLVLPIPLLAALPENSIGLAEIAAKAQAGDFRSAIRLGKSLLASPEALARLNASTGTLQALSSQVAGITTDPRFLSDGR